MTTLRALFENEAALLAAALKTHRARIAVATAAAEAAALAFEETFGFSPTEAAGMCPGFEEARGRVEALEEEEGYYWAASRAMELEMAVGRVGETLPLLSGPESSWACARVWTLRGETAKAHESVGPWVLSVFGMSARFLEGSPWAKAA
jgi:hypothetical protein